MYLQPKDLKVGKLAAGRISSVQVDQLLRPGLAPKLQKTPSWLARRSSKRLVDIRSLQSSPESNGSPEASMPSPLVHPPTQQARPAPLGALQHRLWMRSQPFPDRFLVVEPMNSRIAGVSCRLVPRTIRRSLACCQFVMIPSPFSIKLGSMQKVPMARGCK